MLTKAFIILVLVVILASLGSGLFYLMRDQGSGERTVRALTIRISLSLVLFALLMLAYALGLIQPHGIVPQQ
ncbi:MAG TPA: twin transmembrane helix small protein [Gammaproteobacteria bacterium]|nr:twin transmembrane helix small protein [Gammaproteobacteria bacterium]